jgi:peptide deformylase
MAVVPILQAPHKTLLKKSEKVKQIDNEIKEIIQNLNDTLLAAKNPEGAGLSAPQIGVLKRICIVRHFYTDPVDPKRSLSQEIVLINPKIISSSPELDIDWEACLSIPDTYGQVERFKKVKVKGLDIDGDEIRLNASGYLARVVQHEIDHLDGILFTTKVIGKTLSEADLDKFESEYLPA